MKATDLIKLQKARGVHKMQRMIDDGSVWKMEGSMGRKAMLLIRSGECYLPDKEHRDAYGNRIPSRDELEKGTRGTIENSIDFYKEKDEYDKEIEKTEQIFNALKKL